MHSPNAFVMPARPRRIWRVAIPLVLTGSLAATAVVASTSLSASGADNGTFTISDAPVALNQPTDPEIGLLTPSNDAAENGMFGSVAPFPVLPMHATVARNGHLITFGTPVNTVAQSGVAFDDWDPAGGLGTDAHTDTASQHGYDSFCNSAVTLLDGRILMVSGQVTATTSSDMMTMLYDPATRTQEMGADLAYKRWYVTALRLPDSRILLLGGAKAGLTSAYATPDDNSEVATVPEIGTGTGAWNDLTGATSAALFGADGNRWWYPRAFNGPNGTVVGFSGDRIWSLDPNGDGSAQQTGTLPYDPKVSGSQVMYAPGKILVAGGGQVNNDDPVTASAQAVVLDVNGATPQAALTDPMHWGRNWLNLTALPTGEVFANGGTIVGTNGGDANSVRQSEIWNPATGSWRTAATAQMTRTYHSTSLLMPSGAVFTGGSGNPGPVDNLNGELYYPSYLFTKAADGRVQWASRPAITSISGSATYGGNVKLTIGDGRGIASASLITLPSVTHSQSTDQRRIPLDITQNGGVVTATLPGSVNTMPPGDYELTVVDGNGVPSGAQIISVRAGEAGLVTVAAGRQDTGTADGTPAGTGNTPGAGTGNGAASGTGAQPGTGAKPGTGTGTPAAGAMKLTKGSFIGIKPVSRSGHRVSHTGSKVLLKSAGAGSAKAVRRATSWIVRSGLDSHRGYSFESVDKPGYFLVAPADGAGTVSMAKKSKSSSFAKRATFSVNKGVMGHDVSFRLTAKPTQFLRVSGSRLVVGKVGESSTSTTAATFTVPKGLVSKR